MMDRLLRRGLGRRSLTRVGVAAALAFGTAACLGDQVREGEEDTMPLTIDGGGGVDAGVGSDVLDAAGSDAAGDAGKGSDVTADAGPHDGAAFEDTPVASDATADVASDSTGDADDGVDTSPDGGGAACLTFASHVQPVFDASCALGGCHAGAEATMGMDLSSGNAYAATVGVSAAEDGAYLRVDPGSPDTSLLYLKLLSSPPAGAQMPFGGAALDGTTIDRVRQWIEAGAPETDSFGVCDPAGAVAAVTISGGGTLKVPVGDTLALTAQAVDAAGDPVEGISITWRADDESTLFVDKAGVVLGINAGSASVTASADGFESDPLTIQVLAEQPATASFATAVVGVFDKSCALSGCHVDGSETGDLRLDRNPGDLHESLVGQPSQGAPNMALISPNLPGQSYLFLKLTRSTPPVGAQMPYGAAPTSAADVQLVLRWILAGAPLN